MRIAVFPDEIIALTMGHADTRILERTYDGITPAVLAGLLAAEMGLDTGWTDQSKSTATSGTDEIAAVSEKVPRTGIEPVTRGFSVPCSTN